MTFYLVGPSGAGKSKAARELEARGVARFVDTDCVWRRLDDGTIPWASRDIVLAGLAQWDEDDDEPPLLIAIGAGSQDIDRCTQDWEDRPIYEWLSTRQERVITVSCSRASVFERREYRDMDEVEQVEFHRARVAIYELAKFEIDTDQQGAAQVADEIERHLRVIEPPSAEEACTQMVEPCPDFAAG